MNSTTAYEAIRIAQTHEHEGRLASSAKVAAEDAVACFNREDYHYAYNRAIDSLLCSVGMFHPDYQKARNLVPEAK